MSISILILSIDHTLCLWELGLQSKPCTIRDMSKSQFLRFTRRSNCCLFKLLLPCNQKELETHTKSDPSCRIDFVAKRALAIGLRHITERSFATMAALVIGPCPQSPAQCLDIVRLIKRTFHTLAVHYKTPAFTLPVLPHVHEWVQSHQTEAESIFKGRSPGLPADWDALGWAAAVASIPRRRSRAGCEQAVTSTRLSSRTLRVGQAMNSFTAGSSFLQLMAPNQARCIYFRVFQQCIRMRCDSCAVGVCDFARYCLRRASAHHAIEYCNKFCAFALHTKYVHCIRRCLASRVQSRLLLCG